jgi:hypothetical protein
LTVLCVTGCVVLAAGFTTAGVVLVVAWVVCCVLEGEEVDEDVLLAGLLVSEGVVVLSLATGLEAGSDTGSDTTD